VVDGASVAGDFGAVASTHWLASATAMSVLERGGNAFDAAAAGAFVLQVAEPDQNGLGGEVPILTWSVAERRVRVICGQGMTPGAATAQRFRDLGHELIPGSGVLPACVPGAFDAWMLLLEQFGTWSIGDVLRYAIGYADQGVVVTAGLAKRIAGAERSFRTLWPTSGEVFLRDGAPRAGSRLRNTALARTLTRIANEAAAASPDRDGQIEAARGIWASGFVADEVFRWLRGRSIPDLAGGSDVALLTADDWSAYRARVEEPVSGSFHDLTVFKAQPWSQAPVFLQMLNLLAKTELESLGHNTSAYIHLIVEASKLAFADREAWYGDPDLVVVPIGTLLSHAYAVERARLITDRASIVTTPGSPDGLRPKLPSRYADVVAAPDRSIDVAAAASGGRGGDTAHLSVIDRHGNAVSAMPSGGWIQSSPVIPELGFALGTRAQTMWLEGGLPNSLAPRKRPRTTLSPTLVLADGEPILAFGSPGGDAQDQWGLEFFLSHVVCGLSPQDAVTASTFQSFHVASSFWPRDRRPGVLQVEADLDPAVVRELRVRGHTIELVVARSQGWACAVRRDRADGFLSAAASLRDGRAAGALAR
jgi:gamma-glutamyltranspeptidase/glutathione hydrolase